MSNILDLSQEALITKLRKGDLTLCVVGLGYVGLPLAVLFAAEGARVIGCDVRRNIVEKIARGESPIIEHDITELVKDGAKALESRCPTCAIQLFEVDGEAFCPHCLKVVEITGRSVRLTSRCAEVNLLRYAKPKKLEALLESSLRNRTLTTTTETTRAVEQADAVLITVGTPIDNNRNPDTSALSSACIQIGKGLAKSSLVILKSTVSPGTTESLVAPILAQESGLTPGIDFGLAHMPERIKEGIALYEFRTIPRIVSGIDRRSADAAAKLFSLFPAPIYIFEDTKITEASKLFENIYRDVNIALANELALICETLGLDVIKVIEATQTDPKTHILTPGPGVGGYCLPKDPYYLTQPALKKGFNPRLIHMARKLNDMMPLHIVRLIEDALKEVGVKVNGSDITVLGLAFKGNSGDLRNTPILPLVNNLTEKGARVSSYDPLVDIDEAQEYFDGIRVANSLEDALKDACCVILATDHVELRKLRIADLQKKAENLKAVVDARHVINEDEVYRAGLVFRGLGREQSRK